jgi:hypothetical protein
MLLLDDGFGLKRVALVRRSGKSGLPDKQKYTQLFLLRHFFSGGL